MKFRAVPFTQHGITMYTAVMQAENLVYHTEVDVWHPDHQDGYQRAVSLPRARKFSRYVDTEISPPAILANIRDVDKNKINYSNGQLEIPDEITLWLVDGQHRVAGLKELVDSAPDKYSDLQFPVIIMVGADVYEEAKQFVIINTSQKRVRTDLGERFILRQAKIEGITKLLQKGIRNLEWIPTAIQTVDQLNADDHSIWYNRIRLPNEPKGVTIVSQKAFSDSLKPLLKEDEIFFGKPATFVAPVVNRYWEAIKEVCPEPFENPEGYVMLKTTGVVTLHAILPKILRRIGNESPQKSDFVNVLKKIDRVKDTSLWESPEGEYSRMTGQKGFLIIKIDLLDDLEALTPITA